MISRVLVAEQDADRIAVWRADPISGQLAREQDYSLAGGPAPMALDPAGGWIIVGLRAQPGLALVRLDAHGLPLPEPSRIDLPQDPCYVSVDRTGRFVLSAYYAAGCCAVHRISGEGNLEPDAVQWIQAEPHAHCIQTDPANEYAYLPQTRPADRIQQFHFDAENGSLAALSTPLATIEPGQGPRHYCYHAALGCVFVSNEDGSSVSALVQDSGTGHLSLRGTWSTLPAGYAGRNTCAQIHLHPGGRWLYVSNRGHDSLAIFEVDRLNGMLRPAGHQETEATPRAFGIDPTGSYLYAAGLGSEMLSAYRVDRRSGRLEAIGRYPLGPNPMWVLPVASP